MAEDTVLDGRRVLLVEDEYLAAMDMRSMLEELGCTVVGPARDAAKARRFLVTESIDAAVLDIRLNDEEDYAIADEAAARGMSVVFVSGYDASVLPERFLGTPYLEKPVQKDSLEKTLRALFKGLS